VKNGNPGLESETSSSLISSKTTIGYYSISAKVDHLCETSSDMQHFFNRKGKSVVEMPPPALVM
jgi:hypothetical protein